MIYTIDSKFQVGDQVLVLNYRKKPAKFEPCEIKTVTARLYPNGEVSLKFDVILERHTTDRRGFQNPIWLYVDIDSVKEIGDLPF